MNCDVCGRRTFRVTCDPCFKWFMLILEVADRAFGLYPSYEESKHLGMS
jgi:hypothetical protein